MTLSQVPTFNTWQLALGTIAFVFIYILIQSIRRLRIMDSLLSLAIIALALGALYSTLAVQAYTSLTSSALVAHVRSATIANSPTGEPTMSVELTLYGQDGKPTSDKTYLVLGNEWMVQGDMIKFAPMFSMLGLRSGYKITRLEGRYDSAELETSGKHTVVELNGGDDHFFQVAHSLESMIAPFVDAAYGSAVINGSGAYNIYVSQSGLWAKGV